MRLDKAMQYQKIYSYLKNNPNLETPFLVVDTDIVKEKFNALKKKFKASNIFYAIKANPGNPIIDILKDQGSSFDVASIYEIEQCLNLGVSPDRLSFGNTIKKAKDIELAYKKGIRIFAFDSILELEKIALYAPKSKVFCRILIENKNAMWPLSKKFGCDYILAVELLKKAKELNLIPWGVSFHVGSQQTSIEAWEEAFLLSSYIYKELEKCDIELFIINTGGGLPAFNYDYNLATLEQYIDKIMLCKENYFKNTKIELLIEPGRFLVADAGILKTEVVLISKKNETDKKNWVYLDVGVFRGLIETLGESIKYKIIPEDNTLNNGALMLVNLAGPTCDSMDIMYQDTDYYLPENLKISDKLLVLSTGAYTYTYSSICFNGFPPIDLYFI